MVKEISENGRAKGGRARSNALSPKRRKEIAENAARRRFELDKLPKATHGSADHPLTISGIEIPCYVLEDGTRVLSQNGLQTSIGMSLSGGVGGVSRIVDLLEKIESKGINIKELSARIKSPILFRPPHGGIAAYGFEATILADICDILLAARKEEILTPGQIRYAEQAEILIRGFARVGIIALIDEITGFEKDKAGYDLAKILEAFVAKELQPWVKTFPSEYYEGLFRLYGYTYPPENKRTQWRPIFFGKLTNEYVYNRLAPELLPELKKSVAKLNKKAKQFQMLTPDVGHPKLREHLASIITLMKLSKTPTEWKEYVNKIHPRYNKDAPYLLDDDDDDGEQKK